MRATVYELVEQPRKTFKKRRVRVLDVPVEALEGIKARLWSRIDKSGGPDACWPWTGATNRGYGVLGIGSRKDNSKRLIKAHRLVYELEVGPLIVRADRAEYYGAVIMHTCDNPRCCNPAHLRCGTQEDNMLDRAEKAGWR